MNAKLLMWPASIMLAAALGCTSTEDPGMSGLGATVAPPAMPPAGGGAVPGAGGTAAPPPTVTAGTTAPDPTVMPTAGNGAGGTPAQQADAGAIPEPPEEVDPRGKCEINSGYPGDESCLLPPDPSEGFQIHVGPSDYADAAKVAPFIFEPGQESSQCWTFHTPNTEDIYYQGWVLSGRPGTHHIINTMYATDQADGTTFTGCRDPGTGTAPDILDNLPGASKALHAARRGGAREREPRPDDHGERSVASGHALLQLHAGGHPA